MVHKISKNCMYLLCILEKEMVTHSSILAWEISWTEKPEGLYRPWDHKRIRRGGETK